MIHSSERHLSTSINNSTLIKDDSFLNKQNQYIQTYKGYL